MNAQPAIMEKPDAAYQRPEIQSLVRKQQEARVSVTKFKKLVATAGEAVLAAETKRQDNNDPEKAGGLMKAVRDTQNSLEDCKEQLRVALKNDEDLDRKIRTEVSLFHDKEFKRLLKAYQLAKAESRKRRIEAERVDIELDRKYLTELSLHRSEYPALVDHGTPQIHIGDGSDILNRRVIADCTIGENRTFFELLKV